MSPSQSTPMRSLYGDLPSLGFSSSPVFESPRTVHNHSGRYFKFPHSALPKPQRLTDSLPSSPPEVRANHQKQQVLGPSANLSENSAEFPSKRKMSDVLKPAALGFPTGSSLGKRRFSDVDVVEEYSIMGSHYGFCVDSTGRLHLSPLRAASQKRMSVTREEILSQDSDSDNDDLTDSVEYNAIGAFARTMARSKIETAKVPSRGNNHSATEVQNRSFLDPHTPRSQGSTLAVPSTPLSTGSFRANIMTPPGAVFTIDHLMFSTGMTPYLPQH